MPAIFNETLASNFFDTYTNVLHHENFTSALLWYSPFLLDIITRCVICRYYSCHTPLFPDIAFHTPWRCSTLLWLFVLIWWHLGKALLHLLHIWQIGFGLSALYNSLMFIYHSKACLSLLSECWCCFALICSRMIAPVSKVFVVCIRL